MAGDWFDEAGSGKECDAAALLAGGPWETLIEFIDLGAMVTFAKSSDGGALGVTVTVDGVWRREYFRDSETLESWVDAGSAAVRRRCEDRRSSSADASRSRRTRAR